MLIAFNNDVEFRSRWYHIQTEDNGLKDGHITTNVFFSGQILDSKSTSYKDKIFGVDDPEIQTAIIKELMTKQHQAFYAKLTEGTYEARVQAQTQAQANKASANQASQPVVHGARTTARITSALNGSSSLGAAVAKDVSSAGNKIQSNSFNKIVQSPDSTALGSKPSRPDILRASSQQVPGVGRPVGRINTSQSPKGAFAQPVGNSQPAMSSPSDFSKPFVHAAASQAPAINTSERLPVMSTEPAVSFAVQREKLQNKHAWLGFRWPEEDLSIDTLVASML